MTAKSKSKSLTDFSGSYTLTLHACSSSGIMVNMKYFAVIESRWSNVPQFAWLLGIMPQIK